MDKKSRKLTEVGAIKGWLAAEVAELRTIAVMPYMPVGLAPMTLSAVLVPLLLAVLSWLAPMTLSVVLVLRHYLLYFAILVWFDQTDFP